MCNNKKLFFTSVDLFDKDRTTIFFQATGEMIGTIFLIGAGQYRVEPIKKKRYNMYGIDAAINSLVKLHMGKVEAPKEKVVSNQGMLF